jgi:mannose-6-phosphate isomerase-like protein (cupin superfamily)
MLGRVASPGDVLFNPVSGERLTFVRTSGSTDGTALELEWRVPEGSRMVALPHRHPGNDERFEIQEGRGRFRVGGEWQEATAPHEFTVPRDTSHVHPANVGTGPLRVRQWIDLDAPDPQLVGGIERYFETITALTREGQVDRMGLIRNPLQFALTVSELLMSGTYLSFPPPGLQRPPVEALASLARRLGMSAYHEPPFEAASA